MKENIGYAYYVVIFMFKNSKNNLFRVTTLIDRRIFCGGYV